jgi:hypothetical protein
MVNQSHDRLGTYIHAFRTKLAETERLKTMLTKKANALMDYFGEDRASCDNTKIFAVLLEFRRALAFSKESVEWKLQRAAQVASSASKV